MVNTSLKTFKNLVENFILDVSTRFEVKNKQKAVNAIKNIVFVYIDEIEEGNINTFSPLESGIIPSILEGWGMSLERNDSALDLEEEGGEVDDIHEKNCENLIFVYKEAAFEIMKEISIQTFKLISRDDHEALATILKEINDFTTNLKPLRIVPACKYGVRCYRTSNVEHCERFSHPQNI